MFILNYKTKNVIRQIFTRTVKVHSKPSERISDGPKSDFKFLHNKQNFDEMEN